MFDFFLMRDRMHEVLLEQCNSFAKLVPGSAVDSYDDWLHMGFAICNTVGEEGWEVFELISKRNAKYDPEKCKAQWKEVCTSEG